ncbi:hypothetical protein TI01_2485 [Lysobacter sp. A03]|nr:hypothetical protein TI01_2485 [Lysobacter sp. A03]
MRWRQDSCKSLNPRGFANAGRVFPGRRGASLIQSRGGLLLRCGIRAFRNSRPFWMPGGRRAGSRRSFGAARYNHAKPLCLHGLSEL